MSRLVGPISGLILLGIVAVVGSGILIVMFASALTSRSVSTQALTVATQAADTPTAVPTFTPTPTPTEKPTVVDTATSTPTLAPTDTPPPAPTSTPLPPTSTSRPRPTNTPLPPTETPKPSVDFKVVEQRLLGKKENGDCFGRHAYFITVIDKTGAPLSNIQVRRVYYEGPHPIPFTGEKGPGKTEEVTPRYGGDQLYVDSDSSGRKYTSERTHNLSVSEIDIPIPDLIATGYCPNDAATCAQMIRDNVLCLGHHSYNVVFQRQW